MSQPLEKDNSVNDDIISINNRDNPLVSIVGERTDRDKKLVSFVDIGKIDNDRKNEINAALDYVSGKPGRFSAVNNTGTKKSKIFAYIALTAFVSVTVTMFVVTM